MVATVVAGGALAAAGQAALSHTLPLASDGANVLRLSVQQLLGTPTPTVGGRSATAPTALVPTAGPLSGSRSHAASGAATGAVAPEPRPLDVGELVKATERHRRAAQTSAAQSAARPRPAAAPKPSANPTIATPKPPAVPRLPRDARVAAGAVSMVTGRVSSGFGVRWGQLHRGLDIAAPIGTPIHAPLAGEVVASGPANGFGLWVRIRHDDGTVTTYGHVNRALVRVGEQVTAGQEIAEVGNRGQSTGPHLHVEVQTPGGTTVNPRPWLDQHRIGY